MDDRQQPEPKRSRPDMPAYGISSKDSGMMSWEWIDAQMAKSRNYWICSVTPDNRPHATPVWGVWIDGKLYFACGRSSRKARNLTANPEVVVHLESGDDTVIFEGVVEEVTDKEMLKRFGHESAKKYAMPALEAEADLTGNVYYRLKPRKAFAWVEKDFPNTATRWELEKA